MKLPTLNSVITKGTNDYPSFSKMNTTENQGDMRYEPQGTKGINDYSNFNKMNTTENQGDMRYDPQGTKGINDYPILAKWKQHQIKEI